jgi:hypothetical protein
VAVMTGTLLCAVVYRECLVIALCFRNLRRGKMALLHGGLTAWALRGSDKVFFASDRKLLLAVAPFSTLETPFCALYFLTKGPQAVL